MKFEICHIDAEGAMIVEAESRNKAKYQNYLDWSDAFNRNDFRGYLAGIQSCRKLHDAVAEMQRSDR